MLTALVSEAREVTSDSSAYIFDASLVKESAACLAALIFLLVMATRMPSSSKVFEMPYPIPLLPPVMYATLFASVYINYGLNDLFVLTNIINERKLFSMHSYEIRKM